jgi:hypothetical protein
MLSRAVQLQEDFFGWTVYDSSVIFGGLVPIYQEVLPDSTVAHCPS